jgi:transposase
MLTLEEQHRLKQRNEQLERELQQREREHEQEIELLKRQIAALKFQLFGSPRCEKVSDEQLALALEELKAERCEHSEAEEQFIAYTRERKPRVREARTRFPQHLEEVREEIIPAEVRANPQAYVRIGQEVSVELDIIPGRLIKRVTVRPKFKPLEQLDAVPFIAALPARVVPGGLPSARLVAHLLVSKYVDHLPLYRLEKIFWQRFGVEVPRQRLCDWVGYAVDNWLMLIYHSIRQGLLKGDYLQVDETPIRYLDPERKGKSHTGYFWVFGRPGGDLCFDWRLGRGRSGAEAITAGFCGLLQSDGYAVYDRVCEGRPITQLGCWAHVRRKFFQAWKNNELKAARYLLPIRQLYQIEAELPEEDPAGRVRARREKSVPILAAIKAQLDHDRERLSAHSLLGEAVHYTLGQWSKLTVFVDHAQVRIDNNLTEQAIRPAKLGAKNWLFIGHPDAGHRSAVIYTLLESCRRHGVEPMAYLTDVLTRLPRMSSTEARHLDLTPGNWKPPTEGDTH